MACFFIFAAAPIFVESPVDITAAVGDDITLPCIVRGFPTPSLTWRRQDGRNIFGKSSGHVGTSQLPSGALQIQSEFLYLSLNRCLVRSSASTIPPRYQTRGSNGHGPPTGE